MTPADLLAHLNALGLRIVATIEAHDAGATESVGRQLMGLSEALDEVAEWAESSFVQPVGAPSASAAREAVIRCLDGGGGERDLIERAILSMALNTIDGQHPAPPEVVAWWRDLLLRSGYFPPDAIGEGDIRGG